MKKIFALLTMSFLVGSLHAQSILENSHWNIGPDSIHFQKDTFQVTYIGSLKVTGTYSDTSNILTLKDYSGPEACDSTISGIYAMEYNNRKDTLKLLVISDNCPKREIALDGAILTRIDLYISVAERNPSNEIKIYPNPFNNIIHIHATGSYAIKLYNEQGQLQIEKEYTSGTDFIDTGLLPEGLYILVIMQDGVMTKKRIIKM